MFFGLSRLFLQIRFHRKDIFEVRVHGFVEGLLGLAIRADRSQREHGGSVGAPLRAPACGVDAAR